MQKKKTVIFSIGWLLQHKFLDVCVLEQPNVI